MFKKITLALLLIGISVSLNGMQAPSLFLDAKDVVSDSYKTTIDCFANIPVLAKLTPKSTITKELTQARFITFINSLCVRCMKGKTIIAFYDETPKCIAALEQIKDLVSAQKNPTFLITAEINKTEKEIKEIFNITEPTLVYFDATGETARSTNFETENIVRHIKEDHPENIGNLQEIMKWYDASIKRADMQEQLNDSIAKLAHYISDTSTEQEKALFYWLSMANKPVVVKFSASWCPPCNMMKPIVNKVAQKYIENIFIVSVNVDETTQQLCQTLEVATIPTFIFFKDGKLVERAQTMSEDEFVEKIEKLILH